MAPKKPSMLTRQRQLVKQQKQVKSAASNNLPAKGQSSAGKPRATAQRAATAVRQRVTQDVATLRALGDNMRRNQERSARQIPADPSPSVRRVGPGGANPKPQGQLPPGKQGGAIRQRGGALTTRPSAAGTPKPTGRPQRPSPRPGGRVVVDESPRLPASRGELATTRPSGGGGRPALPPSKGGAIVRSPGGALTAPRSSGSGSSTLPGRPSAARLPGGTGGADTVRGSGVRTGRPGAARSALPPAARPAAAATPAKGAATTATRAGRGLLGKLAVPLGIGLQLADVAGGFDKLTTHPLLTKGGTGRTGTASGRTGRGGTTADRQPAGSRVKPAANYENLYDTGAGRGNYGLDRKPPTTAPASSRPAARPSSGSSSSARSSTSSTTSRPARSSTASTTSRPATAAATPGRKFEDFNPNRGTSKSNNPLLDRQVGGSSLRDRMKERENRGGMKNFNTNVDLKVDAPKSEDYSKATPSNQTSTAYTAKSLIEEQRKKKNK